MGKYIHWFNKTKDFENEYWGENYKNPWISYTEQDENLVYGPRDEDVYIWKKPLTFNILNEGNVGWKYYAYSSSSSYNVARTIEYNKNDTGWVSITATTSGVTIPVSKGDIIQFRGNNTHYGLSRSATAQASTDDAYFNYNYFTSTCSFDVEGNITSLLNSQNYKVTTLSNDATFAGLFQGCTKLVNSNKLRLGPTTLSKQAYAKMFYGCTNMITTPELPALNISDSAYYQMFKGCTKLKEMPELPATTLQNWCYMSMFSGCTSLTSVKPLNATIAKDRCYQGMFDGCSKLETAPTIAATTFEGSSNFSYMFRNCKLLTSAPNLLPTTMSAYCYYAMFQGCESLINAPALNGTSLATHCYDAMFIDCTSLYVAPSLPATAVESYSYYQMFQGCTSLTNAPTISATALASYCYAYMFKNCTGLTTAPTLPATVMFERCYYQMFYGCTSLTSCATLSSTELATYCYSQMFQGCTSLTETCQLPATTLATNCYNGMFYNCTSLTNVYPLNSTNLASSCYENMFYGCNSLATLPTLPATTLANRCYLGMFADTNISTIPSNYLPATTMYNDCYNNMFRSCKQLTSIPSDLLPATTLAEDCYYTMFYGCSKLASIPENLLPANNLSNSCYYGMFSNCTSLISIPSNLLHATNLAYSCYNTMFSFCSALTSIPATLLSATTLASSCYNGMFRSCTSLTSLPEALLPATNLAGSCYEYMFESCTGLTSVSNNLMSATTLNNRSCFGMFQGCTALTNSPYLLAKELANSAYVYMFRNCTNLNTVTVYAEDLGDNSATSSWLQNVSSTGTFVTVAPTIWSEGISGIPTGWTVVIPNGTIYMPKTEFVCSSENTTLRLSGYTNTDFTVTSSNWITVNKTVDLQNNVYDLEITLLAASSDRTGTIQIVNGYNNQITNINIIQNIPSYSINLGEISGSSDTQWTVCSTKAGDKGETVYMSNSNWNVPSSNARMQITVKGMDRFVIMATASHRVNNDYGIVTYPDKDPQDTYNSGSYTNHKWTSYFFGSSDMGNWQELAFENLEYKEHTITMEYRKNASIDGGDDRMYIYVPYQLDHVEKLLSYTGNATTISTNIDCNWSISTNSNWLTISQQSGSAGLANITITGTANQSNDVRTGTIDFINTANNINIGSILVTQLTADTDLYKNARRLPSVKLASLEYIDVGLLNPNNLSNASGDCGEVYVECDRVNSSKGILLGTEEYGFDDWMGAYYGTWNQYSWGSTSGTRTMDSSITTYGSKITLNDGTTPNNSTLVNWDAFTSSGSNNVYTCKLSDSLVNKLRQQNWRLVYGSSNHTGTTNPITKIGINPYNGSYHDAPNEMYPYRMGEKVYFISSDFKECREVKS